MLARLNRLLDFIEGHLLTTFWLCVGYAAAVLICMALLSAPPWVGESLLAPLNLLSWPVSIAYEKGFREGWRQGFRGGIHAHQLAGRVIHIPTLLSTLAVLHLLASI